MKWLVGLAAAPLALLVAAAAALGIFTAGLNPQPGSGAVGDVSCRLISAGDGNAPATLALGPAQVANARIIVGVALGLGLPPQAAVVALAAARQESGLHNLPYGDRDSLGLFQMRPSMGWGSPGQILDPVYAATTFYRHLAAVPDWTALPVTVAAQAVERSAYPSAYARWEPLARTLSAALLGGGAAQVSCPPGPTATAATAPAGVPGHS